MSNATDFVGVTVVIPARNEEKYIKACIMSIIKGTSSCIDLEIIVVDSLSTDKTKIVVNSIINEFPFVKIIENPEKETQFALNKGVRAATKPWVLIAGAHSSFPEAYIETILKSISELNADGAGGSILTDVLHKTNTSVAICKILAHPIGVGNSMFRIGSENPVKVDTVPFGIYKKELFDEVGYYNELLTRNHDMEWSKRLIRAGKRIYLIPKMQCTYYARETFKGLAVNNFRNGLWNILTVYVTKTTKSLSIRHFAPFAFVMSLILPLTASVINPFFSLFSLFFLLMYISVITFTSFKIERNNTTIYHLILAFFTIHFAYGMGSIIGLFNFSKLFKK
ncbi:MAG: glycosyltransferase family 2 protein [Bacteroidales bacterium]|nr:glycosyltransferase family 2 protein [Bacteroidales bacterium]